MNDKTTEVKYTIEGTLDGKPWVPFLPELAISEAQATEMYDSWVANREATGFSFRYRLVRRTSTVEILASEETVMKDEQPVWFDPDPPSCTYEEWLRDNPGLERGEHSG
jgi:hypothetical protein